MQNQPNPDGAQAGIPVAAAAGGAAAPAQVPTVNETPTNTYGIKALLASLGSLAVSAVTAFVFQFVFIYFALLGAYAVYAGIRGIITSFRVPRRQGLVTSIIGLILGVVAIVFTVWLVAPAN